MILNLVLYGTQSKQCFLLFITFTILPLILVFLVKFLLHLMQVYCFNFDIMLLYNDRISLHNITISFELPIIYPNYLPFLPLYTAHTIPDIFVQNVTNISIYWTIVHNGLKLEIVMHRMNANRISNQGTASLTDSSVQRIETRINHANERRSQRHKTASIKKTAQKVEEPSSSKNTGRIIVAGLNDIPSNFERMGTGFYRDAHHLWELTRAEGGYVLVRKQGEDHVLGYDHEPLEKQSSILDRHGVEVKKGSKVRFPFRGKVATGTVVIVTPSALGVNMDSGGAIDVPPDMLESFVEEEAMEGEHSQESIQGLEEFAVEESEEHEQDKESGAAFEPEIEATSKIEQGPAGPTAEEPMEMMASVDESEMKGWKEYWRSVGQRVAQAKEYKPPKPKLTDAEKAQRAKERREKLKQERKGLPPGAKLPPKPKAAALDSDEKALYKEKLRLYEQLIDELKYILQSEPLDPQEIPFADQFMQAIEFFEEEKDKLDSEKEEETERELSLEEPSERELELQGKGDHKIVSMADLT